MVPTVRDSAPNSMVGPRAPGRTPTVALATASAFADDIGGEELLVDALAERGADPTWVPWDDPSADWATYDLVVVRTTWDYPDRLDAFRAWVRQVAVTTVLVNPARLMLGNLHKSYVADEGADAVVQPYLAAVERSGEASVVCIEGEPTHAVRKRPASGEFRIHAHRGGTTEPVPVTEELADIARRTLATLPARPAYARVDMIHDGATWRVVELELVEPYLYLEHAPRVAGLLAEGLLARVGATVR